MFVASQHFSQVLQPERLIRSTRKSKGKKQRQKAESIKQKAWKPTDSNTCPPSAKRSPKTKQNLNPPNRHPQYVVVAGQEGQEKPSHYNLLRGFFVFVGEEGGQQVRLVH